METAAQLLRRITSSPKHFGGKPVIRGRRLAIEHVLGMLAAGDIPDTIIEGYPWMEREDTLACLAYAHRILAEERVEPLVVDLASRRSCSIRASGAIGLRPARLRGRPRL